MLSNEELQQLKTLRVLYVEDDADIREELTSFLRRRIGELLIAVDGQMGVKLWEEQTPDIIITDIVMPKMDGLELSSIVKQQDPDIPIIVTTAFNEANFFLKAIDIGIDQYVLKPIATPQLLRAVKRAGQQVWQRKQLAAQQHSLQLSAKVFENSIEGILITDQYGRIVRANRTFNQMSGYPCEELVGQPITLIESGQNNPHFFRQIRQSLQVCGRWQGEFWSRRQNGEIYPQWLVVSALTNESDEVTHYVCLCTDISKNKFDAERIEHLTHYDLLTNLPNRVLLYDRIRHAITVAEREKKQLAVLMLDLDRFKKINESLGHHAGDELLCEVARRLTESIRHSDTVARHGGDEFVLVLADVLEQHHIIHILKSLLAAFEQPFKVGGESFNITISIGVALYPQDGTEPAVLIKNADSAMYVAKEQGRNLYQFYRNEMNAGVLHALLLENELRQAIKRQELCLYYQPQVDINTGLMIGVEALVRWNHPELGLVSPGRFIPVAEETLLIHPIGDWVLAEACRQMRVWHEAGYNHLRVAVNLSAVQLQQKNAIKKLQHIIETSGLALTAVELELTESMMMQNAEDMILMLEEIKALNVKLAVDDFGTGYSSLAYLKRFPIDKLKIDMSFVREITSSATDLAISRTVIALGHNLGLRVIAEGVENAAQLKLLQESGCHEIQGYYFSPPVPPGEIEHLLAQQVSLNPMSLN